MRLNVVLFGLLLQGCAAVIGDPQEAKPGRPDTSGVLRVIGRFSTAHACPISESVALTSAHVTDLRPFDRLLPAYPLTWSDGAGNEGVLRPWVIEDGRDLAYMTTPHPFARWYALASAGPAVAERLWTIGYDWRTRGVMYAPREITVTVLRVIARNVISSPPIPRGASGACVLNAAGEVVAVNAWGAKSENGDEVGVAVGVWGEGSQPAALRVSEK